jgi:hypothetical protein
MAQAAHGVSTGAVAKGRRDATSSASLETINDQLGRPADFHIRRQHGRSCRAPLVVEGRQRPPALVLNSQPNFQLAPLAQRTASDRRRSKECGDASSSASLETINSQLGIARLVEIEHQHGRSCRTPSWRKVDSALGARPKQLPRAHARKTPAHSSSLTTTYGGPLLSQPEKSLGARFMRLRSDMCRCGPTYLPASGLK